MNLDDVGRYNYQQKSYRREKGVSGRG